MANEEQALPPRRRYYSKRLKAEVVQACGKPGASIAGVALTHGINANIVHRWLREHASAALTAPTPAQFLPIKVERPEAPVDVAAAAMPRPPVRIEVQRGSGAVVVSWPLEGASACASWLSEWLK